MSTSEDFFVQSFSLLELALLQVTGSLKTKTPPTVISDNDTVKERFR